MAPARLVGTKLVLQRTVQALEIISQIREHHWNNLRGSGPQMVLRLIGPSGDLGGGSLRPTLDRRRGGVQLLEAGAEGGAR